MWSYRFILEFVDSHLYKYENGIKISITVYRDFMEKKKMLF